MIPSTQVPPRSLKCLPALIAAAIVLSACTSAASDESTASSLTPTSIEPTTTQAPTTQAPTTQPPATAATTSTTVTIAETQWTEEELEIIGAYEDFQSELVAVLVDPALPLDRLESLTSTDLAAALNAQILDDREREVVNRGSVQVSAVEVRSVSSQRAELVACVWGRLEELVDGEVTVAADPAPLLKTVLIVMEGGSWRYAGSALPGVEGAACRL